MQKFNIYGMSCASCAARIEKAVKKIDGVVSCSVNLLTNSMIVESNVDDEKIIKEVEKIGYKAKTKVKNSNSPINEEIENNEISIMKRRLISSIIFLIPLMYISMGHMMWKFPLPQFLSSPLLIGISECILTIIIMVINKKFFINGFKSLINKSPNMDALVALGSSASFLYSFVYLIIMIKMQLQNNIASMHMFLHNFYFESAATILTLITVGKMLEEISKGKTTNAIKSLMKLSPKTATIIKNGNEIKINIDELKIGDIFIVKPGENIPVDAIIVEGNTSINESSLTGESIPAYKKIGDEVYTATTNINGNIVCRAIRVGEDTTLSQIIEMVSEAAQTKAPIAKIADKISSFFVPTVIILAILTFIVWEVVGEPLGFSLTRAVSVLVISCPCALGLATPVAIMVANGVGAKNGIMFKNAVSLEQLGKTQIVVLDKTGTITKGEPSVQDIIPYNISKNELIQKAYSLEIKSEHPLAKAIVSEAESCHIEKIDVEDFNNIVGNGVTAKIENENYYGGNFDFVNKYVNIPSEFNAISNKLSDEGKTPIYFAKDDSFMGIISVSDVIKEDSINAIKKMNDSGLYVVMLTGDNEKVANYIAKITNVQKVFSNVKPIDKENVIKELKEYGKVCMVGDGINDAIALTRADVGIAIGAGVDIAIDSASVVLMKNSLMDVYKAIKLSQQALKKIHGNLFWAFFYNIIGIPLAMGVLYPRFGLTMSPMFGALAMSFSSFFVVTNALRLNLFDINKIPVTKIKNAISEEQFINTNININKKAKENKNMKIIVEGMMCGHCEAHVQKEIEKIDGVLSAKANHQDGIVNIETNKEINEEDIKNAVIEAGYEYKGKV